MAPAGESTTGTDPTTGKDKGRKEPAPKHPCIKCSKNVKTNDKAVQCKVCELWVHITCQDISEEEFKMLCKLSKNGGVHWMCNSCDKANAKLNSRVIALESRMSSLEGETSSNTASIYKVVNEVRDIKESVGKQNEKFESIPEMVQNLVHEELNTRERKRNNIVIHNIQESQNSNVQDRKADDYNQVVDIMKSINIKLASGESNDAYDVKFTSRLGQISDRPRPLLIGLASETIKNNILANARKLQLTKHKLISIVPDLTNKQRTEDKKMREEKDRLNNELSEDDFLVFEWKLVGPRGQQRLAKAWKHQERPGRGGGRQMGARRPTVPQPMGTEGMEEEVTEVFQPTQARTRRGTLRNRDSDEEEEQDQPSRKKH